MKVKKYYKTALFFAKLMMQFLIIKVIVFQLWDGWHWEPISEAEKWCGKGAEALGFISLVYFLLAIIEIIEEYIKYSGGKE